VITTLVAVLLLAGCGVDPTGVTDGGEPPTGVASGPTLYFVDSAGVLQPDSRTNGRLGTVTDALALLLTGPGGSDLSTEIDPTDVTRVEVTVDDDVIALRLPIAQHEATALGVDQIVCTAIAAFVQGGGSTRASVRLLFTISDPTSDPESLRRCPLIPAD
jgi:hypothetical protein